MTLYKATKEGNVPMTPQEEAEVMASWNEHNSLPNKKARLRQAVSKEKASRDFGAVSVNGKSYPVNFAFRMELSNAYVYLLRNTELLATVETTEGESVDLDLTQLGAVFDAVNIYATNLAKARKQHFDNIKSLNNSNIDAYDTKTIWP